MRSAIPTPTPVSWNQSGQSRGSHTKSIPNNLRFPARPQARVQLTDDLYGLIEGANFVTVGCIGWLGFFLLTALKTRVNANSSDIIETVTHSE